MTRSEEPLQLPDDVLDVWPDLAQLVDLHPAVETTDWRHDYERGKTRLYLDLHALLKGPNRDVGQYRAVLEFAGYAKAFGSDRLAPNEPHFERGAIKPRPGDRKESVLADPDQLLQYEEHGVVTAMSRLDGLYRLNVVNGLGRNSIELVSPDGLPPRKGVIPANWEFQPVVPRRLPLAGVCYCEGVDGVVECRAKVYEDVTDEESPFLWWPFGDTGRDERMYLAVLVFGTHLDLRVRPSKSGDFALQGLDVRSCPADANPRVLHPRHADSMRERTVTLPEGVTWA